MKFLKLLATLTTSLFFIQFQPAYAEDNPADAVAMVEKGLAYMQKNGKDALAQEINNKNPEFINGSIYLDMRGMDGAIIAHPVNPKLIGKNMLDLPDADGKYYRKDILTLAKTKGKGWVDYRYNNPVSKQIENKTTYIFRSNDVILEAGIYKGK
ncbi:cache domain-containing protein [Undibacterium sp. CY18W]|uniref:Cache domain-containing protein n=1 Tax=Undibacterium hunanense TaxID=2762292 RepID=A0ABR6ZUK2_9BURK|nr:cache domain-containing protein [Undibacterium hunanense]MBC3919564.1 cache domain-containing protein [Undibacterium hunanense]